MNDTIYRYEAINALIEWYGCEPYDIGAFEDIIEKLPSVQEQKWIPVSKGMPNGQELVNVSCHDTSGDTSFDYTSSGWVTTDGEYWIVDNEINNYVVAWTPLPKPYKEEK